MLLPLPSNYSNVTIPADALRIGVSARFLQGARETPLYTIPTLPLEKASDSINSRFLN